MESKTYLEKSYEFVLTQFNYSIYECNSKIIDRRFFKQNPHTQPANTCMFKVNNRNTRTRCEICSKLTNFTYFTPCSSVSIVNFEQVKAASIIGS